jgi:hypothetical protein
VSEARTSNRMTPEKLAEYEGLLPLGRFCGVGGDALKLLLDEIKVCWAARSIHETTSTVSNDVLEILREVSTLDCFYTGSSCPPDCQCLSARAGRAAHETTTPPLLDQFTAALKADPDLAWSWHCNLAMPIMDRVKCSHTAANEAAADLMRHLFHIDIRSNSCWAITMQPVEPSSLTWEVSRE